MTTTLDSATFETIDSASLATATGGWALPAAGLALGIGALGHAKGQEKAKRGEGTATDSLKDIVDPTNKATLAAAASPVTAVGRMAYKFGEFVGRT